MDDFNLFDKEDKDIELEKVEKTDVDKEVTDKIIYDDETVDLKEDDNIDSHYKEEDKSPHIGKDGVIEGTYVDVTEINDESEKKYDEKLNNEKSSCYSETIINEDKPKNKNSSFKKFVAGILVASLVGGPMIGLGVRIASPFAEKLMMPIFTLGGSTEQDNQISQEFSFNNDINAVPMNTTSQSTSVSPGVNIYQNVAPSVVGITSTLTYSDFFNKTYDNNSSGSGIIFNSTDDKVYIVTNNHVINNASKVAVTLFNGEMFEATLVGADSQTDLAVISINKSDMDKSTANSIVVARFGDSSELQIGELAVAIGNPLGQNFSNSMSQGIISGLDREVQVEDRNLTVVQTDAAINPGNSGGALVNSKSEVIGINTIKVTNSDVEGMGFAIPTNIAKPIIEELMKNGYISRPKLGIVGQTITEQMSEVYQWPVGVFVAEVSQGSSAQIGGIKVGDIIVEFDKEKITSMDQLSQLIKKHKVGDKVSLKVVRNGNTSTNLTVTLQDSGAQTQQTQTQQQQYYFNPFNR